MKNNYSNVSRALTTSEIILCDCNKLAYILMSELKMNKNNITFKFWALLKSNFSQYNCSRNRSFLETFSFWRLSLKSHYFSEIIFLKSLFLKIENDLSHKLIFLNAQNKFQSRLTKRKILYKHSFFIFYNICIKHQY